MASEDSEWTSKCSLVRQYLGKPLTTGALFEAALLAEISMEVYPAYGGKEPGIITVTTETASRAGEYTTIQEKQALMQHLLTEILWEVYKEGN